MKDWALNTVCMVVFLLALHVGRVVDGWSGVGLVILGAAAITPASAFLSYLDTKDRL